MSNTVLTYPDNEDGSDNYDLERLLFTTELPMGPLTLLWRAFTRGHMTWQTGSIVYTLTRDNDAKAYHLITNNLVA